MAYLNWRDLSEQELRLEAVELPQERVRLEIRVPDYLWTDLGLFLQQAFSVAGAPGDHRLEMPRGWRIFFKEASGNSRILISHPDAVQWVGTLLLASSDVQKLLQAALQTQGFSVSEVLGISLQGSGYAMTQTNGDLFFRRHSGRVVVVEDVAAMRELLVKKLTEVLPGRPHVFGVSTGAELRRELLKDRPHWVVLDEILPGESAADLGQFLESEGIAYVTVSGTPEHGGPLFTGAQDRLAKPHGAHWEDPSVPGQEGQFEAFSRFYRAARRRTG